MTEFDDAVMMSGSATPAQSTGVTKLNVVAADMRESCIHQFNRPYPVDFGQNMGSICYATEERRCKICKRFERRSSDSRAQFSEWSEFLGHETYPDEYGGADEYDDDDPDPVAER